MKTNFTIYLLLCVLLNFTIASDKTTTDVGLIPWPQKITIANSNMELTNKSHIIYSSKQLKKLAELLQEELYQITSVRFDISERNAQNGDIVLKIDESLSGETHMIAIGNKVEISGSNYKNTTMASVSLLQAIEKKGDKIFVPKMSFTDTPHSSYRALMIDVARQGHTIDTLKQCVVMCRMYKMNYLQLHLTDDQSFTFGSEIYPKLATPGRHFTKSELKDLVAFADARGVTIIPEFDAPGHTTAIRNAMPELFGRSGLSVINLGKEEVYDALENIVNEMCEVFSSSPYFHIGADESYFGNLAKDPIALQAIKDKGYDGVHDLFLEFIVRMNGFIKKNGKQTVMWESFQGKGSGKITVPNDIIVMAWETLYQLPQSLLDNGYTIINVSWKPAYLTPGRRWNPEYIYNWNMFRWENHWNIAPSYVPIQLKPYPNDRIIGGMMCSWESKDEMQIPGIRLRIAPLSERIWAPELKLPYENFEMRFKKTDQTLQKLIRPVDFITQGLTDPDYVGPFYNMENRFATEMTLKLKPLIEGSTIRYTIDGSIPTTNSPIYSTPIKINKDTVVRTQVFAADGAKLGFIATKPYEFHPITGEVEGLLMTVPHDDFGRGKYRTQFGEKITVTLQTPFKKGVIRYTTNGREPNVNSDIYTKPIELTKSGVVLARYFDQNNKPQGTTWRRQFDQIDAAMNLTTGKPVTASVNSDRRPAEKAVDGIVDREFHWDGSGGPPQWWQVDLEDSHVLKKIQVVTYWDGHRYYQYNVEVSLDGKTWNKVVDFSKNTEIATKTGFMHEFEPIISRYIRITMLYNSANPGQHLVEVRAFTE